MPLPFDNHFLNCNQGAFNKYKNMFPDVIISWFEYIHILWKSMCLTLHRKQGLRIVAAPSAELYKNAFPWTSPTKMKGGFGKKQCFWARHFLKGVTYNHSNKMLSGNCPWDSTGDRKAANWVTWEETILGLRGQKIGMSVNINQAIWWSLLILL